VQTFFRATSKEVEIAGVRIGPNRKLLLFLAAANRDPRRWEKAHELDVRRNSAGHVAFGSGVHVCVGQMLGRLEAELWFAAFARRVASFEPAGEPVRRPNNIRRGLAALLIRVRRVHQ
jgi:4-methoxybenzoate monooxygenase (O-demethylating)